MVQPKSTQSFVPIKEIRDGVAMLKDGSMRMILMASSLNFALKSEDEQNAIILQYQNFLNSLDFPIQIFVSSRKLDIVPYIGLLEDAGKEQANDLLRIQIREYVEFIKNFVKTTNIVTKTFYIVIPYNLPGLQIKGDNPFSEIFGALRKSKKTESEQKNIEFEEVRVQLQQRAGVVQDGLARIGIRTVFLNTEELIELFYKLFNPGEAESGLVASQVSISKQ